MKMLITTLAMATTLIAAPAFAQSITAPPSPNNVTVGGKNIGQDPDSNVRLQLRRDHGSEGF
jgi:hypothetical protein